MSSEASPEPEQPGLIIYIGRDSAGRWLVQDSAKRIEGRFVSYSAAKSYAEAERDIRHATVMATSAPLEPSFSCERSVADPRAMPCAA